MGGKHSEQRAGRWEIPQRRAPCPLPSPGECPSWLQCWWGHQPGAASRRSPKAPWRLWELKRGKMSDKDMRSLGQQWGERWPRLGKQQEMWGGAVQGSELRQAGNKCLLLLHPQGVHVSLVPKQGPGRVFLQASHLWGHPHAGVFF